MNNLSPHLQNVIEYTFGDNKIYSYTSKTLIFDKLTSS